MTVVEQLAARNHRLHERLRRCTSRRADIGAGTPVTLKVRKDGAIEHDLDLPAADLHVHAKPGQEETATLQIDQAGTYDAQCLIPGHAEAGMVMQVVVQ